MSTAHGGGANLRLEYDGGSLDLRPGGGAVVGRDRGCDVVLVDTRASRRHLEIRSHGPEWVVVDLGSSNGSFVDGGRIPPQSPVPLRSGMRVSLGGPDGPGIQVTVVPQAPPPTPSVPVSGPGARLPGSSGPHQRQQQPSGGSPTAHLPGGGSPTARMPGRGPGATAAPPARHDATGPARGGGQSGPQVSQQLPRRRAMPLAPEQAGSHTGVIFDRWTLPSGPIPQGPGPGGAMGSAPPRSTLSGAVPQVVPTHTPGAGGTITIGRGLENQIVVDDLLVSRHHSRLTPRPGGFDVVDLDSRNGTYVNGQRIGHAPLNEGDLLAVGHSRFTVRHGQLVASIDEGDVNFVANHLSFTLDSGKKLLDDISFGLDGSSLLAVIGPSGAGKSTLLKALTGSQQATEGEVYYDGRDLYQNYQDLRHRIGVVPQDDVVHRQLTVRQALNYAAELRFPDDLDKHLREQRVEEVMGELGLTQHSDTRVDRLSGGQRKRTSVALELLTRPSLLFLDEPTSGLDPGLDKQVMNMLRGLADGGRTVVVITHSVANLDVCDKVLLLAPGGKVAYFGPPNEMLQHFAAKDHADVFVEVARDPERAKQVFLGSHLMEEQVAAPLSAPRRYQPGPPEKPPRQQSIPSQLSTLARRQLRVILADKGYAAFMLLLPVVLAVITMVVPGQYGLGAQPLEAGARTEPLQLLVVLIVGAIFMGTAASVRELVSERAIYLREKAVGLSPQGYLASKLVIFGLLTLLQSILMVLIVLAVKKPPADAIMLGSAKLELVLVCWFTAFAAVSIGLLMSSIVKTSEQVMPLLVISVMAQLVLCGGLFPVEGRPGLEQLSWLMPSRWGYAGSAAVTNVRGIFTNPATGQPVGDLASDPLWKHEPMFLILSLVMLTILGLVFAAITLLRIVRQREE